MFFAKFDKSYKLLYLKFKDVKIVETKTLVIELTAIQRNLWPFLRNFEKQ